VRIHQVDRLDSPSADLAVVVPFVKDELDHITAALGQPPAGLDQARQRGELRGSLYSVSVFRGEPSVFLVGAGSAGDLDPLRYLRAVAAGARSASRAGFRRIAVVVGPGLDHAIAARASVEGVVRGVYDAALLKTRERESFGVDELTIIGGPLDARELEHSIVVAESANVARDLLNLPPADLTPTILADKLCAMAAEVGLECRLLGQDEISALGMGAILGVSKGSAEPPRLIDIRYGDENSAVKLAYVGKGLTFDSGGLSLKTADGMVWMKGDMGGAAAVAGAMRAIGLLKPPGVYIRGLIGSVENMPGPAAMKPGDVLRTLNGKTIEVLNTDSEGRLVLADMLAYAVQGGATNIVDVATLTGAVVVALGPEAAGIIGMPREWIDKVLAASSEAMERLWPLPIFPEHRRRMESTIADMKNTGGRAGGALTASAMMSEFVDDVPWAHLDIAGTAWEESKTAYAPAGGSGFGVATLVQLAFDMAA